MKRKTSLQDMKFIDLRTGYLLTGFADFERAFAASEFLCEQGYKIAYLNEASHVRESEVFSYTRSFEAADTKQYQNYHFTKTEYARANARESLKTACEVLEQNSASKAKFILVVEPQKVKAPKTANAPASVTVAAPFGKTRG